MQLEFDCQGHDGAELETLDRGFFTAVRSSTDEHPVL